MDTCLYPHSQTVLVLIQLPSRLSLRSVDKLTPAESVNGTCMCPCSCLYHSQTVCVLSHTVGLQSAGCFVQGAVNRQLKPLSRCAVCVCVLLLGVVLFALPPGSAVAAAARVPHGPS